MFGRIFAGLAIAAALVLTSAPALRAGEEPVDEQAALRRRVAELEERLARVEKLLAEREAVAPADQPGPHGGQPALGAIITCEAGDIRFTMGGNIVTPTNPPTQGASGLGHVLFNGQSLYLSSGPTIRTFQFIAHTNGVAATLQITPLFERG